MTSDRNWSRSELSSSSVLLAAAVLSADTSLSSTSARTSARFFIFSPSEREACRMLSASGCTRTKNSARMSARSLSFVISATSFSRCTSSLIVCSDTRSRSWTNGMTNVLDEVGDLVRKLKQSQRARR